MRHLTPPLILSSLTQIGLTITVIVGVALAIQGVVWLLLSRRRNRNAFAMTLLIPGLLGILVFTVVPMVYEIFLAFTDMIATVTPTRDYFHNPHVGLSYFIQNLGHVLGGPQYFLYFGRTMLYTLGQVLVHVTLGLFLAQLLNRKMRLRPVYQALLTLPWAIPPVISYTIWSSEMDTDYGIFNILLRSLDLSPILFSQNDLAREVVANLVIVWASTPLVFLALYGGLQSIPAELMEAADLDGAKGLRRLFRITLPLLRPVLIPIFFLDFIWTANNANPSIMMWGGPPVLSSMVYWAFQQTPSEYAVAATFASVSFGFLFMVVLALLRITGAHTGYEAEGRRKKTSGLNGARIGPGPSG